MKPLRRSSLMPQYSLVMTVRSPFRTAEAFWIEEIIDPRDTRRLAAEFASLAGRLREPGERRFCMRP